MQVISIYPGSAWHVLSRELLDWTVSFSVLELTRHTANDTMWFAASSIVCIVSYRGYSLCCDIVSQQNLCIVTSPVMIITIGGKQYSQICIHVYTWCLIGFIFFLAVRARGLTGRLGRETTAGAIDTRVYTGLIRKPVETAHIVWLPLR